MSCLTCSVDTRPHTTIYTIMWKMNSNNFKYFDELRTKRINITEINKNIQFQLKLKLLGESKEMIQVCYSTLSTIFVKVDLMDNNDKKIVSYDYTTVLPNKWQNIGSITKFQGKYSNVTAPDHNLHLKFVFQVYNSDCIPSLTCNFKNLLDDYTFSDLTIKSTDGEMFKVHKAVLAYRSAVLKAHLAHRTEEEIETNTITSSFDKEVLQAVLTYIYSDEAPNIDEIPEKLLAAADFYQLSGLKALCEEALSRKLTLENVVEIQQLAELYNLNFSKECIKDFLIYETNYGEAWNNIKDKLPKSLIDWVKNRNKRYKILIFT